MKKIYAFALCSLLVSFSVVAAQHNFVTGPQHKNEAGHTPHWGYEGESGPKHWGDLSEEFAACSKGKKQSPINIADSKSVPRDDLAFSYKPSPLSILNNGHTIQVNYASGSMVTVPGGLSGKGESYSLKQFHFHAPAEHTIKGKRYAMEVHLVHENAGGKKVAVGILIEEGNANTALASVFENLPQKPDETINPGGDVSALDILPGKGRGVQYYNYDGSLTTPPCSEGLNWFVLTTPIHLSRDQIQKFEALFNNNSRPLQLLNGRPVLMDSRPSK